MKNRIDLDELLINIEDGKMLLTKEQKEKIRKVLKKPIYNDNWDKLKAEIKEKIDSFNYTNNNKTVICSLSIQEAISILLRVKYKVKSVREIQEPYNNIKNFTMEILDILGKDRK